LFMRRLRRSSTCQLRSMPCHRRRGCDSGRVSCGGISNLRSPSARFPLVGMRPICFRARATAGMDGLAAQS
jgi:hypothetical protein